MDLFTVSDKESIYWDSVINASSFDNSGCFFIIFTINLKALYRTDGCFPYFSQIFTQISKAFPSNSTPKSMNCRIIGYSGDIDPSFRWYWPLTGRGSKNVIDWQYYRFFLKLSPLSSIRYAVWTNRSRIASAIVSSPMISYQLTTGSWLVIIKEFRACLKVHDVIRQ